MSTKVKVGIIGLGFMGTTHLDIYRNNEKAEVVAIADIDQAKLAGDVSSVFANIGGGDNNILLDLQDVTTYSDGMDLISDPNVDLVDICVPTFLHRKYAIAALEASKHVMLEKPIGRTSEDAKAIVKAADRTDKCFTVGMCVRAWPEYRYVYEQFSAGKYGKLVNAFFKRFSPTMAGKAWEDWFSDDARSGGALLDLHLHDIDAILYFFGRPHAVTSTGSIGFRGKGSVDHVFTFYDFSDGKTVVAEGGWSASDNAPFEMSFQLVCEKATVIFNASGLTEYFEDGTTIKPNLTAYPGPTGWHQELNSMLEAIQASVPSEKYITPGEMIDGICLAEAERKSIDNNGDKVIVEYK